MDEEAQKLQEEIKGMVQTMKNPPQQQVPPTLQTSPHSGHGNYNRTMLYLNSLVGKLNSLNDDFFMDFTDMTNATLADIRKEQRLSEEKKTDEQQQVPPPAPITCIRFKDGSIGYNQGGFLTKCRLEDAPVYDDSQPNGLVVDVTDTIALDLRQSAEQSLKDQGLIDNNGNVIVEGNAPKYTVELRQGLQFPHTDAKHNSNFVPDTEQSQ